jgi:hypothetical protein
MATVPPPPAHDEHSGWSKEVEAAYTAADKALAETAVAENDTSPEAP